MKRIHVVAAVIECGDEVLIARRPDHVHQGGKWEFPGGKLEAGESAADGLVREIHEELGISVTASQPLIRIAHDYPDKQVLLDVWRVTAFAGEPTGVEGQDIRWVARNALRNFEFPAANVPIVAAVQLPPVYVISPDVESLGRFVEALEATIASGARLIQIRVFALTPAEWRELLPALRQLRDRFGVTFLLNSATAQRFVGNDDLPGVFAGIHLTSVDLQALNQRPVNCQWLAASCHSREEIEQAERIGVDFVTLSPVKQTRSHPDAQPLGWEQFAQWVDSAHVPVYGLGGLQMEDLPRLQSVGAQGAAGISGFWVSTVR
jgi:8-oxo-dGTP diphosphatase